MPSADDVASVIIARSGPWLDAMSLQKLLYYVQAWHLALTDEPLFRESIKAWRDGPVVPAAWHNRREAATRRAATQEVDDDVVDAETSDIIGLVLATYGSMSGSELSALTHVEWPWREARGDLPENAECREPISTETMARFYRSERRLTGRTAADLAAGGVHVPSREAKGPADVDAILDSLEGDLADPGDDPWGGGNLVGGDAKDTRADSSRCT